MEQNKKINYFGLTSFRNEKKRFGIKQDDRRRHFYTIGKTGMGKSNLMENMAIQDIQNGNGIAYVDPHGEGAEKLLDFVPAERINDVVFFNPSDLDYPIAFNVMEKVDFKYRHLVAGGLMAVFKKVWPDVWSARMEYILSNAILALLEYPDSTLLGVNRMLADPDYRAKVVAAVTDPIVKSFWVTEYSRYTQRYEIEATAAIQNKVGQFVSNALIRNIIGQSKSTIDMRKIMDEQKILILDLSKGRIGEDNSRLLGALLITKLQLAAMSRVDIPESERKDFYLYVDEFQNFATESFASILSEARKYRLCLIVGHQYINQMDEMVRDAVFGNVGTMAVFRVGAEDAEFLEKEFSPHFTAEDLVNLAKYNIYLKLMIDGIASHPFSAQTLEPPQPLKDSNRERIINASRGTYSIPRQAVEESINAWTQNGKTDASATSAKPQDGAKPASKSFTEKKSDTPVKKEVKLNPLGNPEPEQQKLYDVVCAMCGKNTKVIFEPKEGRPVYCKSCLKKMKQESSPEAKDAPVKSQEAPASKVEATQSAPVQTPVSAPVPVSSPAVNSVAPESPKLENIKFSSAKHPKPQSSAPKRKEINLSELKKAVEESLKNKEAEEKEEDDDEEGWEEINEPTENTNLEEKKSTSETDEKEKGIINPGQKVDL